MAGLSGSRGPCVACGLRGREAVKYRCPNCPARYCSVTCCKKHKEHCTSRANPVAGLVATETSWSVQREDPLSAKGRAWSVDDILTEDDEGDKVPVQKLQLLKESEGLRSILANPHLRQLLLTIDQAGDKSTLMRKYMQEPLFVEFADCCLRIVEPSAKESEMPE